MNRAGGVGVFVRQQALKSSDNIACAAGADSFYQTLSYSHPHVLVDFAPKVTRQIPFEPTVGRTLHSLGDLRQIEAFELALALQNIRHIK